MTEDDPALREAQKAMVPREPWPPFKHVRQYSDLTVRVGGALLASAGSMVIFLVLQRTPKTVNPALLSGRTGGGLIIVPYFTLYGAYLLAFGKRRKLRVIEGLSMLALSMTFALWWYYR